MNRTIKLGILILIALAPGCVRFTITDTNKFYKGMSATKVLESVPIKPTDEFNIKVPSDPNTLFYVLQFDLHHGGIAADYFLLFKGPKLLYWGYPYEFNRYPDPVLNEIGAELQKDRD